MKYIVYKRFCTNAICGPVDIPAFTECRQEGPFICCDGRPLCVVTSENAHRYFARDYDGKGLMRAEYTGRITEILKNHPDKWQKVWADEICARYRRKEHKDHWIWSHDFYIAPTEDLEYIYSVVR